MEEHTNGDDRNEFDAPMENATVGARPTRWKRTAKQVAGGVAIAGAAVAVTLVATRREAQRQNLIAFLRGQVDGLKQGGWLDGWTAAEEWYAELGLGDLAEALAQQPAYL